MKAIEANEQLKAMRQSTHQSGELSLDIALLMKRHHKELVSFIFRNVRNHEDAEDIAQSTFMEAFRCIQKFEGRASPKTWLFGIAVNLIKSHYGRNKKGIEFSDIDDYGESLQSNEDLVEKIIFRDEISRIDQARSMMNEQARQIIHILGIEDIGYKELAVRLQIPVGTVRSCISRARAKLRLEAGMQMAHSRLSGAAELYT